MVCILPKAGNHFGRPKGLSYHLGHSCCWPPPRSETEEGCYLGREHSYCYYFKLKIIRKMFIPIRNKNIDRAMLANLEPPPSKTTAMWGPEGAGTMVCVVCDVHVFVNGCRHVCTLSKSSPEKQKNILPVKSLQKSWRGTFKGSSFQLSLRCVDISKDSVVSIPVKNRYHPSTCSSQKSSSHPPFSLCSISNPSEILTALLRNISQIPPFLPPRHQCVPVIITSDMDQASWMVSLLSPLLPHSPFSKQQLGPLFKNRSYAPFSVTTDLIEAHVENGTSINLDHRVVMINRVLSTSSNLVLMSKNLILCVIAA